MNPIIKAVKALQELGWKKIWYYALYQIGLRSGHYRRTMPSTHEPFGGAPALAPYPQFPHDLRRTAGPSFDRRGSNLQRFSQPVWWQAQLP